METLPLWLRSYAARHGVIGEEAREKILGCSPRTLERITAPCRGGEARSGVERIEKRLPFPMLGFDFDNGSEFLNEILEAYLLKRRRSIVWTRSRAYKKNDQARVEQENFTHVRQLPGYGRFGDPDLRAMVNELYEKAWLPLRKHFKPVMKLVGKQRIGAKVRKKYGKRVLLVLDNASWHKTKSMNWHHIEPVYLPPYSPDFNPIERLWQHLKSHYLAGYFTKD